MILPTLGVWAEGRAGTTGAGTKNNASVSHTPFAGMHDRIKKANG